MTTKIEQYYGQKQLLPRRKVIRSKTAEARNVDQLLYSAKQQAALRTGSAYGAATLFHKMSPKVQSGHALFSAKRAYGFECPSMSLSCMLVKSTLLDVCHPCAWGHGMRAIPKSTRSSLQLGVWNHICNFPQKSH